MKNDIEKLVPADLIRLARFSQAALIIVNARLFTLLGTMLSACAFGWVLWEPNWIRAFGACAFALLVFWPLQRMEAHRITQTEGESE